MAKNGKQKRTPKYMATPGQIIKGPTIVVCAAPMDKGGSLGKAQEWTIVTRRAETGDWYIRIRLWGTGPDERLEMELPDAVCKALFRHHDETIRDSKKIRGQKAFQTAKQNAERAEVEPGNQV